MPQPSSRRRRLSSRIAGVAAACVIAAAVLVWYAFLPSASTRLFTLATAAYDRGEIEHAGTLTREYRKQFPEDSRILRLSARVASRQGRDDLAISLFSKLSVADLEPTDFSMLGRALAHKGSTEAAIRALETAVTAAPNDPETLDALAELYIQNDRHFAAEQLAARLAAIPSHQARGNLLLGTARDQLNDSPGAAAALRQCFALDPELNSAGRNPVEPFRLLFVRSLLRSGQSAEAEEFVRKVAGNHPSPEQNWLLSRALMQQGQWSEATAILKSETAYRSQHEVQSEPAPFIGSARCAECHRQSSNDLLASRHASTFTNASGLNKLPLPKGPVVDPGNPSVQHRLEWQDGRIHFKTEIHDQVFQAVAQYAFGSSDHFSSLVGPDSSGQLRMLRMSHYESPRGSGWDLTTNLALEPAAPDEYLGKRMDGDDGLRRCLACHTTNFRAVMDGRGPEAADHSIGCEACHGPGAHHVAAVDSGFSDLAIAATRGTSAEEINRLCARCHTMHKSQAIAVPRTDPLWMRFPSLTLTWSRCYSESGGKLSCVTCHDPHQNADSSVPRNEARCLACHTQAPAGRSTPRGPEHASTAAASTVVPKSRDSLSAAPKPCPVNASSGCLNCHMTRTWDQKTHSFKTDHYIRVR